MNPPAPPSDIDDDASSVYSNTIHQWDEGTPSSSLFFSPLQRQQQQQQPQKRNQPPAKMEPLMLPAVVFPSIHMEKFRLTLMIESSDAGPASVIWAESKKTKRQWKTSIKSFKDHGPELAVPDSVIHGLLARALEESTENRAEPSPQDPKVDAIYDCSSRKSPLIITLSLSFMGAYDLHFTFELASVDVEEIAVLGSRLKDALDEIEVLRSQLLVLEKNKNTSATILRVKLKHVGAEELNPVTNEQTFKFVWSPPDALSPSTPIYRLNDAFDSITFVEAGTYQIQLHVGMTHGAILFCRNSEIISRFGFNFTGQWQHISWTEVEQFAAGDTLSVYIVSHNTAHPPSTKLTVLRYC